MSADPVKKSSPTKKVSPIERGSPPKNPSSTRKSMAAYALGTCCLGSVCLACSGCIIGSAGCAAGTQECIKCIKKKAEEKLKEKYLTRNPNYDPSGESKIINKGVFDPRIIATRDIVHYIKTSIGDQQWLLENNDDNIKEIFELDNNYKEKYHTFEINDRPDIDDMINQINLNYIYHKNLNNRPRLRHRLRHHLSHRLSHPKENKKTVGGRKTQRKRINKKKHTIKNK
jgi:hypothetical protein